MTITETAPTILTREGARRLTGKIRDALALADDLLVRAYEGRAWEALGHASWEAYCAAELPELRLLSMRPGPRRERAEKLLERGASEREIAAATGSSTGTAHNDVRSILSTPRPTDQPVPRMIRKTDRVAALVTAAGQAGLDVRDVQRALRCERHEASATLSRLVEARRIAYAPPARRGLFGRYTG